MSATEQFAERIRRDSYRWFTRYFRQLENELEGRAETVSLLQRDLADDDFLGDTEISRARLTSAMHALHMAAHELAAARQNLPERSG